MFIATQRIYFFWVTSLVLLLSMGAIAVFGLNPGADFTGGTLVEVSYTGEAPPVTVLTDALQNAGLPALVRPSDGHLLVQLSPLSDQARDALPQLLAVNGTYQPTIDRFSEVGPTLGKELRNKAYVALLLVVVFIMLYVAFAFRAVSKPVSSWVYGLITIVVLLHDVIIPAGVMALLGYFLGTQADTLFVVALLTILGYSVNDTIVVFDRVREKLKDNQERNRREDFVFTVGRALDETFARSFNTSLTTALALIALFFFGPTATQDFALILIAGVVAGTYSSIALAAPLLITYERWRATKS